MLRRILSSAILLVGIASIYFFHVRLRFGDLPFYRKIMKESAELHASSALEKAPVRQTRRGVCKDIWTIQEGKRVHGRIACAGSDLTLTQKKEKMEGHEILRDIEAWIDAGDGMRRLTAESGVCHFPSCEMEAGSLSFLFGQTKCAALRCHFSKDRDTVQFLGPFQIEHPKGRIFGEKGTLRAEGASHRLQFDEGVLFEGTQALFTVASQRADAVISRNATLPEEIRFSDNVQIQSVSGIRAVGDFAIYHQNFLRLFPKPGSACSIFHSSDRIDAQEIQFDKEEGELLCLSPHGRLEKSRTLFDADTGRAQFRDGFEPQTLLLEGNVRIASHLERKESFALADSAAVHLHQKKIVLESAPSSRVLFRQEGLEISAPTVHLQEGAIQGFGDVRFSFSPEEKTALEPLFLKFL